MTAVSNNNFITYILDSFDLINITTLMSTLCYSRACGAKVFYIKHDKVYHIQQKNDKIGFEYT